MSYCDLDEAPAFYRTGEVVARKQHRCCECNAPILKGEKHTVCIGKWDSEVSRMRQHTICALACEFVRDHIFDECLSFGELKSFYREFDLYGFDMMHKKKEIRRATFRRFISMVLRRERAAARTAA